MKKLFVLIITILIVNPINSFALSKTETIHVNMDFEGNISNTTVNTKLTNLDKGDIVDYTYLTDIKNLNGDEKLSLNNEKLSFKSTGKDVVYKGKLDKNLPISVSTKYYLNGDEISYKNLKDKKGTIRIEYSLKNNSYNNGLHTPFVVSLVSLLDGKKNSNVSVTTGKVVSTGNKNIVIGIAAPGLYDDLGMTELSDMDKIIISYDTTKYEFNDSYLVMTPKLLDDIDLSRLNKVDYLNESLNVLQNGMNRLEEGSNSLASGSNELGTGMDSLNNGIKKALDGSNTITKGLEQVNAGSNKLSTLATLVDTLYNSYIENANLLETIQSGVAKEQYEQAISGAVAQKTDLENKLSQVNAGISALEQLENLSEEQQVQLATLKSQKEQLELGIKQYADGIADAEKNLASLPLAAAKLEGANEAISKILTGILEGEISEENINSFKENLNTLLGGINSLQKGSSNLTNGLNELAIGSDKLTEGTSKLVTGSNELSQGITKINNEGIKKLSGYGNKLVNYSNKVKRLVKLSKEYSGFASDNSDSTIFVYKISK